MSPYALNTLPVVQTDRTSMSRVIDLLSVAEPITPFPETDAELRQTIRDAHKKEKCFDKRPIKYMTFTAITPMPAYRYVLESFIETRVITAKTSPFRGQMIPPAKKTPAKWSVKVPPPPAPPGNAVVEFYETSNVIRCPTCGKIVCERCVGRGTVLCYACGGDGYKYIYSGHYSHYQTCFACMGSGRATCNICNRNGWLTCPQCEGVTRVVSWNMLTVTWVMDVKTHNTSRGDLSPDLLDKCEYSGIGVTQLSTPENPRPLEFLEEPDITDAAAIYMEEMMEQKDWKVIAFRQAVVDIPIVKVDWTWKDKAGIFYIYGAEQQIHFLDEYPGCCWGGGCCCGNSACAIV